MPDNTLSTLDNIVIKVRRLTRNLSENQLATSDINSYVNNFVLYDFPEHLRLFNLHSTLTFYCQPNVDVYDTTVVTDPDNPLYNFLNRYIAVQPPIYIAGYQSMFSQSREQFFGIYPQTNNIQSIGTAGDGVTTDYTGFLSAVPVLRNNVLFSSVDINGNGLAIIDQPVTDTTGILIDANTGAVAGFLPFINYVTGQYEFTFPTAPAVGQAINSQTVPYVASLPQALLFFNGQFTLRPVPDQPYRIQMEVDKRPSELLNGAQMPELSEWWQYIAYGAARKVLQDRMDMDTLAMIEPEYKKQESLVLRRTIVQQTTQRTSTIYTEQTAGAYGFGWWYGGGQF